MGRGAAAVEGRAASGGLTGPVIGPGSRCGNGRTRGVRFLAGCDRPGMGGRCRRGSAGSRGVIAHPRSPAAAARAPGAEHGRRTQDSGPRREAPHPGRGGVAQEGAEPGRGGRRASASTGRGIGPPHPAGIRRGRADPASGAGRAWREPTLPGSSRQARAAPRREPRSPTSRPSSGPWEPRRPQRSRLEPEARTGRGEVPAGTACNHHRGALGLHRAGDSLSPARCTLSVTADQSVDFPTSCHIPVVSRRRWRAQVAQRAGPPVTHRSRSVEHKLGPCRPVRR